MSGGNSCACDTRVREHKQGEGRAMRGKEEEREEMKREKK
jgi:hypothetical protein